MFFFSSKKLAKNYQIVAFILKIFKKNLILAYIIWWQEYVPILVNFSAEKYKNSVLNSIFQKNVSNFKCRIIASTKVSIHIKNEQNELHRIQAIGCH